MKISRAMIATVALGMPFLFGQAQAAELKVLSTNALKAVIEALVPQFEKTSENKLTITWNPAAVLKADIEKGAAFDVAFLTVAATDDLAKQGKIDGATRATIAHAGVGVAMKKGAPKPDISTSEGLKTALLNAKSIGYVGQGASGAVIRAMFDKLGIAEQVKPKLKLLTTNAGAAAASGEVEIGMTQISEILPIAGAELVGPLPKDVQGFTYFSGGVAAASKDKEAAKALIKFLTGADALKVIKAKGMEPG
jgi:molybdate transport system substrate-binding protein